jgi:predicted AlkP superfamily pyrophosphatase or phosphodiesterase
MEKLPARLFDHETTLVNLTSSLLAHYGVTPFHKTIKEVDEAMGDHRKIAFFLFDGSGEYILNTYPRTTKFMREHKLMTIHSVNPATTVACTTALLTGKFPIENGWLGWSLYVDGYTDPIDVFPNKDSLNGDKIAIPEVYKTICPLTYIDSLLKEKGVKVRLDLQVPLWDGKGPKSLKEMRLHAHDFFRDGGEFYYGYWTNPDHVLHERGIHSCKVRHTMHQINSMVKRFVKENPDVLVFTLADHGLLDVQYRDLKAFPAITDCLAKPTAMEGRTTSFFLKEGKEAQFVEAFNKEFSERFALVKTEDLLKEGYFGEGEINPKAYQSLGDYLAIALSDQLLCDTRVMKNFSVHKGHHAGATTEECEVLLGCYNR